VVKVVLVGNTIPPDAVGGLPRYVRELAAALARSGCEVVLLAKRVDRDAPRIEVAPDGVKIIRHGVPSKRNPLFAPTYPFYAGRGVLSALRAESGPLTVIHGHFPATALAVALGGLPYVYTFHAPVWRELLDERQGTYALPRPAQRPAVALVRAAERAVVRRAAGTFVLSEFMRSQLGDLDERVAAAAHLMPGGVDTDQFCPDPAARAADPSAPLLFTARRLTPRTGVDRLIAAMPEILAAHPLARLAVAGTGEMGARLRDVASELGVAGHVNFLGYLSDASLVDWYRRATLVVMPTVRLEGFGLTAAEALACGTPVLATPVGALPELLEPVDPMLVARDSTPRALATAVNGLLANPGRLRSTGERGHTHVTASMGWDAVAGRYIEAYEEALTRSSRPASPGSRRPRRRRK
jgi:glycosyltransferase involved in cell wall biosynthesis